MLGLQATPGTASAGGRSRYSKALPSVPVAADKRSRLPPLPSIRLVDNNRTQLPSLPSLQTDSFELSFPLPPASSPPPANDDGKSVKSIARKPVGSSTSKVASPLPAKPGVNSAPMPTSSSPGSMAIPRKAVVGALQPPAQATPIVPPEPSPTDSIGSLLSAYTRDPDTPLDGDTYTAASTGNSFGYSYADASLVGRDGPSAGNLNRSQIPVSAVKKDQSPEREGSNRPSPPPKDDSSRLTSSSPKTLPDAPAPANPLPRPEIWKRRPQTAEKNKELPDLNLNHSHGSTASTSSIHSTQTAVLKAHSGPDVSSSPPGEQTKSSVPRPAVGLPGRNVRPAPKNSVEETESQMGSTSSKLKGLKDKSWSTRRAVDRKDLPIRRDSKRPPTPEYRTGEASPPSAQVDNITKPASPVSAAASPKEGALSGVSKSSAPQPNVPPQLEANPVSAVPLAPTTSSRLPQAAPDLRQVTSLQELRRDDTSPPRESSPPSRAQFPPRGSSTRGVSESSDSARSRVSGQTVAKPGIGEPRRPGTATGSSDPRIVYSEEHGPMYRGRDGTMYPVMRAGGEAHPKASYFPVQTNTPLEPGTIFPSKRLTELHYNCYQKHKTMNRRSNRHYPLTCQTCDKADVEDRWVCTFCNLSICETCLRGLNGHQKVLRSLVGQLGANMPLSLSSSSRPGSALGIELPT